ncbi:MAG TPA: tetratricopeptide repeat protein, partial [Opitutus sp.]|nr:tetratricopeptide repeat protein [Opitutus sp.]
ANGTDRDKQRIALELLARASLRDPQLADFRQKLDALVQQSPPHPILEDLLLFRAQAALDAARIEKTTAGYAQAEDDAQELLEKFPGSPLKAHAWGVLTDAAWEQRRYRTAADDAKKAQAELPPGPERSALGVLIAEAWFRARDYRSAADAYAAALRERPANVPAGDLMFQRVLAEIEAGAPEVAAAVLDEMARTAQFDQVDRWQAEWNLARALQAKGKTAEAYARVTALLGENRGEGAAAPAGKAAALPVELRARMAWLQARLAMGAGKPDEALKLADAIGGSLGGLPEALRTEIASSTALLRGEANFALGRDAAALEILKKLRTDFPRSNAAVYSYFDEAEHYEKQDKIVEAQQLLTKLADDFPDNEYAPFALFQAALQAERRGQETNLREANGLIEDLVKKHPQSPLVFAARMKQGDLLRKLNDFPAAQRVYEELVNKYSARPDIALAQLALAETHNAQAANEPTHTESALVLFEHVLYLHDEALIDARVEAGYNIGRIHERRNEAEKAETVWWRDVVNEFLLNGENTGRLGDKGRYWMTRTLLDLGSLYEKDEKLEQAKQAWLLILNTRLGYGEALARARLARFNLADAVR